MRLLKSGGTGYAKYAKIGPKGGYPLQMTTFKKTRRDQPPLSCVPLPINSLLKKLRKNIIDTGWY